MRLKDRVAIITGASSGMGKQGALVFSKEGAKVVVADLNEAGGQETVELVKKQGGEAVFVQVDVCNLDSLKNMADFAYKTYGKIDILWNNVGMPGAGGILGVEEKDWDICMAVNAKGGFFGTKYVVPYMQKNGGGSIIFTSSTAGLVGSPSSPLYSAAKGAVTNMVRALGTHLGQFNIRVNAICPALTNTPMAPKFITRPGEEDKTEENLKFFVSGLALGRMCEPSEIATAALFLASDDASFVTGTNLSVDGGFTAK